MKFSLPILVVLIASCSSSFEEDWKETRIGNTNIYVSIPQSFDSNHLRKELSFEVALTIFSASSEEKNQDMRIAITEYPDPSGALPGNIPLSCDATETPAAGLSQQSEQQIELLNTTTKMIKCQSEEADIYVASLIVNEIHFTFAVSDHSDKKNFDIKRFINSVSYHQM